MPSAWEWWAGEVGEDTYDLGNAGTREAVIVEALREASEGAVIQIIEARSSSAARYDGADFVPFLRTRNHEIIGCKGPSGLAAPLD